MSVRFRWLIVGTTMSLAVWCGIIFIVSSVAAQSPIDFASLSAEPPI